MSRSNPTENTVHPCTRWLEWHGSKGHLEYYDKTAKKKVEIGSDFTFIVLDQLSTVKGWHDATESGIFSNEVKDTRTERLTVKAFKGGGSPLAEGIYRDIKDRVDGLGGYFVAMVYIAYENEEGAMQIGSIAFNGAALRAWMDFQKAHRSDLYSKAVHLNGSATGKKGSITFKTPKFEVVEITEDANSQATMLDKELQEYFRGYFARAGKKPAAGPEDESQERHDDDGPPPRDTRDHSASDDAPEDDIPF